VERGSALSPVQVFHLSGQGRRRPVLLLDTVCCFRDHLPSLWTGQTDRAFQSPLSSRHDADRKRPELSPAPARHTPRREPNRPVDPPV